jgi:hypothetical protein
MTKLTLSVDDGIIAKAKAIASERGMSVSGMFSSLVVSLEAGKTTAFKPGRLTRQATGLITSPDINEKEILEAALMERHGS